MKDNKVGVAGTVVSNASGIVLMAQAIDLMSVMVMFIGIVSGIISIIYNVVMWYKKATSENGDGGSKVTIDEVKEGIEKIDKIVKEIVEENKNGNKNRK